MAYITKFNRLDEVWFMADNFPRMKTVYSIEINHTEKGVFISYYLSEWVGTHYEMIEDLCIPESKLFSSHEELIKSL